ncbi:hypothetical protein SERLA73DRAFT_132744 [Serpula lacrymans var. lacrymans S7.3]|uniref:Eukaryotic translation initiation factor 3 subunit F n=2 Tax=Serpula lacrymans var. lacrymans TaxID=341189 RepID=F8PPD2_SERL3|nr:uncharacterized protein SERLADRAFT_461433 [Serpula lacrymans var. lacrymans S7.9]EGO02009.1 hypothetical protein SERLA73DRAFT_132744 [Serpula lacrymans var. lacrymans S7.3]EGO27633.1 hypothetical protein SERLADRAFT_461433 [Serpula lacrymans var. lacrymans S7.9]
MPLGSSSSAVHILQPAQVLGGNAARTPTSVTIHPAVLCSILDHYLRRTDSQERVIGTLLGTRTDTEIDVRSSFAVLHSETSEQVAVDMEYHRTMYELHHRVNPKQVIVGWYSTGSNLNTYSALIQNFYSQETAPHQAVHVVVNTGLEEGVKSGAQAYVSSPVGIFPKPENCVFVPIPCELRYDAAERNSLELLTSPTPIVHPTSELEIFEQSLQSILDMMDRVLGYVRRVLAGEVKGDPAVGRYLMDTIGTSVSDSEGGFNTTLQDTLMVSYLATLMRSQAEISSRLSLVTPL